MIRILMIFVTFKVLSISALTSADETSPAPSAAAQDKCAKVKCKGPLCGCTLLKQGWKEIARCEKIGEYLIENGRKRMLCSGVPFKGGVKEDECTPFMGRVTEFLRCR